MTTDDADAVSVPIARRGLMLVLSSPSGAGKSTIARNLMEIDAGFELSVSVTTRARRGSEIEGVHYRFVDERTFMRMRDDDDLLEWAEVHGNHYATPRAPVKKCDGIVKSPVQTLLRPGEALCRPPIAVPDSSVGRASDC